MDKQQFSKFTECLDNFLSWIDEKGYQNGILENMIKEYQDEKSNASLTKEDDNQLPPPPSEINIVI
jgi:hypothetical protein